MKSTILFKGTLLAGLIAISLVTGGCSDDDDSTPFSGAPQTFFTPSGTERAADVVRLAGFGDGSELVVFVAIGGPTTSSDVFAFNFGIDVGSSGAIEYVQGSAAVGEALIEPGCAQPILLVAPQGNGLTVAISKLGPCVGNPIAEEEENVLSLRFRMLGKTSTTLALGNAVSGSAAALDASGSPIPGITFDTLPATATRF